MSAATALTAGLEATPHLVSQAIGEALEKAAMDHARGVVLYLSEHFRRDVGPALVAAAKASRCLQVAGALAEGVFTETGWVLDRPAVAALVLGGPYGLAPAGPEAAPLLSFAAANGVAGHSLLRPRYGFLQTQTGHWQHGRLNDQLLSEVAVLGATPQFALASGWRPLSPALSVTQSQGLELLTLQGLTARESAWRHLPADQREPMPLHQMAALLIDADANPETALAEGRFTPVAVLGAHPGGAMTLSHRLTAGQRLIWALRQSLAAESDMREALRTARARVPDPAFGLMASCLGRGPGFYGAEDRDLLAWQETLPGVPLLGAYGSSQFWPAPDTTRVLHHAAVTTLFSKESPDVQPLP